MKYYLAIDLGAGSGRHIVGWKENGEIRTVETYRFENHIDRVGDALVWDVDRLFAEIKKGITVTMTQYPHLVSLSIDTWGVDYVLMNGDRPIMPVYAYRDPRTEAVVDKVHSILPFAELYARTGIQFVPFNSIYQLYCDKISGRLQAATDRLMLPEYFAYLLTGVRKKEYTNATTTGLVNAAEGRYDEHIISTLGYPACLFGELNAPGSVVGALLPEIAAEVGGQTEVVLCPSHDTASAYDSIDNEADSILISSGTWSLIGAKLPAPLTDSAALAHNFTNEGGVGYIRFLKNMTGMWINANLQREYGRDFATMTAMAESSDYDGTFDVNDPTLTAPQIMSEAVKELLRREGAPEVASEGDLYRAAYRSLAAGYGRAVQEIEAVTGRVFTKIYVLGGGAKNALINRFTAEITRKQVVPVPIEATAIGNLRCQMKRCGE